MVEESDIKGVYLKAGEAKLEASKELTEYFITDDPQSPKLFIDENGGVAFQMIFKRRLTNEAVMTFLPSLLLITITYTTSFFKLPNFFNTAITVNLTVMLTTTTLLISVVNKLAQTSYIKWIEAWLVFAQMIPFTQVILITLIEWSRTEDVSKQNKIEHNKEKENENRSYIKRCKEPCWLNVNNKLIKVTSNNSNVLLLIQGYPIESFSPSMLKESPVDAMTIILFIGQFE